MLNRFAVLLIICFSPIFSLAGVQSHTDVKAFVINVTSDCMLVVSIDHQAEIVRLAGIAYPTEESQENDDARVFISDLVLNKNVRIERLGEDRWGNIIGHIYINQSCLSEALIQSGLAKPAP